MERFYVYRLIDPRDGSVFYVGKGSGRRMYGHEAEAEKGVYSRKCNRIRSIWADGFSVKREVVSRHVDENDALEAEARLIEEIGLEKLTNVMPGGVMGIRAYLARQEESAQQRRDARRRVFKKELPKLAPKLAHAIRVKAETGGFGMMVGNKWCDFSPACEMLLREMAGALGIDVVADALRPHGVEVVGTYGTAEKDTHQSA